MPPELRPRGLDKNFKHIATSRETVILGGFSKSKHIMKTCVHDGGRFIQLNQWDDWIVGMTTGKNRKHAHLRDNDQWQQLAGVTSEVDECLQADPFAAAVASQSTDLATADQSKHKKKRRSRKEHSTGTLRLVTGETAKLLLNKSKSSKELWIAEDDVSNVLTAIARSHAQKHNISPPTPEEILGKPQWLSGRSTWILKWKDTDGTIQTETCRPNKLNQKKTTFGVALSPTSWLLTKKRAYQRCKQAAKERGWVASGSESDSDDVEIDDPE